MSSHRDFQEATLIHGPTYCPEGSQPLPLPSSHEGERASSKRAARKSCNEKAKTAKKKNATDSEKLTVSGIFLLLCVCFQRKSKDGEEEKCH
jgi:hypothetical protein